MDSMTKMMSNGKRNRRNEASAATSTSSASSQMLQLNPSNGPLFEFGVQPHHSNISPQSVPHIDTAAKAKTPAAIHQPRRWNAEAIANSTPSGRSVHAT